MCDFTLNRFRAQLCASLNKAMQKTLHVMMHIYIYIYTSNDWDHLTPDRVYPIPQRAPLPD